MTLRVVLDTNVIVSAALDPRDHLVPRGRPSIRVSLALSSAFVLVASNELLAEYGAVLVRPSSSPETCVTSRRDTGGRVSYGRRNFSLH